MKASVEQQISKSGGFLKFWDSQERPCGKDERKQIWQRDKRENTDNVQPTGEDVFFLSQNGNLEGVTTTPSGRGSYLFGQDWF